MKEMERPRQCKPHAPERPIVNRPNGDLVKKQGGHHFLGLACHITGRIVGPERIIDFKVDSERGLDSTVLAREAFSAGFQSLEDLREDENNQEDADEGDETELLRINDGADVIWERTIALPTSINLEMKTNEFSHDFDSITKGFSYAQAWDVHDDFDCDGQTEFLSSLPSNFFDGGATAYREIASSNQSVSSSLRNLHLENELTRPIPQNLLIPDL